MSLPIFRLCPLGSSLVGTGTLRTGSGVRRVRSKIFRLSYVIGKLRRQPVIAGGIENCKCSFGSEGLGFAVDLDFEVALNDVDGKATECTFAPLGGSAGVFGASWLRGAGNGRVNTGLSVFAVLCRVLHRLGIVKRDDDRGSGRMAFDAANDRLRYGVLNFAHAGIAVGHGVEVNDVLGHVGISFVGLRFAVVFV